MGKQSDRTMQVGVSSDDAFSACLEILQNLGHKITASDQRSGFIQGKAAITMRSWGETIIIQVSSLSPTTCRVNLTSKSTWFTLVDYGKNDENVDSIQWRLSRQFTES